MKKMIRATIAVLVVVMLSLTAKAEATGSISMAGATKGTLILPVVSYDSIPALGDSTEYLSNVDMINMDKIIKLVMDSDEYRKAGDSFSKHQILVGAINQYVILPARKKWDETHKIKKDKK